MPSFYHHTPNTISRNSSEKHRGDLIPRGLSILFWRKARLLTRRWCVRLEVACRSVQEGSLQATKFFLMRLVCFGDLISRLRERGWLVSCLGNVSKRVPLTVCSTEYFRSRKFALVRFSITQFHRIIVQRIILQAGFDYLTRRTTMLLPTLRLAPLHTHSKMTAQFVTNVYSSLPEKVNFMQG